MNQDNGYIVYDIPADNKLIKEIAAAFKEDVDEVEVDAEEMDDSAEIPIVSVKKLRKCTIVFVTTRHKWTDKTVKQSWKIC